MASHLNFIKIQQHFLDPKRKQEKKVWKSAGEWMRWRRTESIFHADDNGEKLPSQGLIIYFFPSVGGVEHEARAVMR